MPPQIYEARELIYTEGCVNAVLGIAEENLYIIGGVAIGLAVPQVSALHSPFFKLWDSFEEEKGSCSHAFSAVSGRSLASIGKWWR